MRVVRFAVSAEDGRRGGTWSGLSWDECNNPQPYTHTNTPPTLQHYRVDTYSGNVEVEWSIPCVDLGGLVDGVEAITCSETQLVESKGGAWPQVVEVVLVEGDGGGGGGGQYTTWVRIQYRGGLSSWSAPLTFTITEPGLASWVIGLLTTICIVVAVTTILGLLYGREYVV
ncbi:hypothetical protein Pcinc_037039 [Petrolisthes cinctipes]|uniref:Uncharacterized protein n=1 Tax=Petrolisthes cinctipes TaxID=88211 RepID=A0AAE1BTQ4_PETCI|nr:hypothetical protein Pcinc_037039 [Petrolisthes cinctipes]